MMHENAAQRGNKNRSHGLITKAAGAPITSQGGGLLTGGPSPYFTGILKDSIQQVPVVETSTKGGLMIHSSARPVFTPEVLPAKPTARYIKSLDGWNGDARLYGLSEPMKCYDDDSELLESTTFVVVSAVHAMFSGPETYIFAADSDGGVKCHLELGGSYRGGLSHETALNGAGYEVVQ